MEAIKKMTDFLEWESQKAVSHHMGAGKHTGVFGRAASALNYRAISLAPNTPFLTTEAHILLVSSSSGMIK